MRYKPHLKEVSGWWYRLAPGCGEIMGLNNPLQAAHPGGLLVAFVDGSVQFISGTTDLAVSAADRHPRRRSDREDQLTRVGRVC